MAASKVIPFFILLILSTTVYSKPVQKQVQKETVGIASYYGSKFHNRKTAGGVVFNQMANTAAHRTLPFGTKVRVTNLSNKKTIIVVINDRGPFVKGRIIDLAKGAAYRIGIYGLAKVKLQIITIPKKN